MTKRANPDDALAAPMPPGLRQVRATRRGHLGGTGYGAQPTPPAVLSDDARQELRAFSPAADRLLRGTPSLHRFLVDPPNPSALARIASAHGALARRAVRLMRARVFVHTAYTESRGGSPLTSGALWARAADESLRLADRVAAHEVSARRGPPAHADGTAAARAILALGKLGSNELNPSSDIDLLLVYAKDGELRSGLTAHEWHVAWAKRVMSILHDTTDDGFAFRVDFDLRPEGTQGPLVNSADALESYYERFGQTWERAALLRARVVVDAADDGPQWVGGEVLSRLRPFVFPRRIDARAVDALFQMKQRVTAEAREGVGAFDVKRGRGGIREVEFVVQALQLLHGGRDARFRHGDTLTLIAALEDAGHLPHRTACDLRDGYVLLRRIEHALQYREDRQTQLLPADGSERAAVERGVELALARAGDRADSFEARLAAHRAQIARAFDRMLGVERNEPSAAAVRALDRTLDDDARIAALQALGFALPGEALGLVRVLERTRGSWFHPASIGTAAVHAAHVLDGAGQSPAPMQALARLPDLFRERVPRATLDKLAADRGALALVMRLLALSAPLSRLLARHGIADLAIEQARARTWRRAAVDAEWQTALPQNDIAARAADDEEEQLVRLRRVVMHRQLGLALAFLGGQLSAKAATYRLSNLAQSATQEALRIARTRIASRHGALPGFRFCVVALGSFGGQELGFFRDLDVIFLYDTVDADRESEGKKPVGAGELAARLAQQFLWTLTAPLAEGTCYPVDSRLRPSGNHGSLTTSLAAFTAYHAGQSALWEKQALLRARSVAGDRTLFVDVHNAITTVLAEPLPRHLGLRLGDMRARMVAERASGHGFDLKLGEGGIADVEFAAQGLVLSNVGANPQLRTPSTRRMLQRLLRAGMLSPNDARTLLDGLELLVTAREAIDLVDDGARPGVTAADARLDLLTRASVLDGPKAADLYQRLLAAAAGVREVSGRVLRRIP